MLIASDVLTASRATVRRAIARCDAEALEQICQRTERHGASWLDLNPGHVKAAEQLEVWRLLVETAEQSCDLALMLDTIDAEQMKLALRHCSRPPVLNMATPASERLGPILELAAHHELDVVGGLFTGGIASTAEERLELAALIVGEAEARGIPPARLILDPIVAPLATPDGERQAAAVLDFFRQLPLAFDEPPRTMIGLSNLTTGSAGERPRFVAAPFLHAAHGAGLDIALLDTDDASLRQAARLCRVFEGELIFAAGEFTSESG